MAPDWLTKSTGTQRMVPVARLTAIVAVAYFISGWLGLQFPYYGSYVTLVWVPTAIALVAVVLAGAVALPGAFLGSFAINVGIEPGLPGGAALLALSNTLAPGLSGLALVHRYEFRPQLDRLRDAFAFLAVGVVVTGLLTATLGALLLCLFDRAPWADYPIIWLTWFGGEAVGSLIAAPLLLTWLSDPDPVLKKRAGTAEKYAMMGVIAIFCVSLLAVGERFVSLPYGFGLLFVWIIFRTGLREALLALAVGALVIVVATALGVGPFAVQASRDAMLSLWLMLAAAGSGCVIAGAVVAERDRALQSHRRLLGELDHRVKNALATVVALAERGRDGAHDIDEYRNRFIARVRAIARTHEGLARSHWEPMQVREVVAMTLAPFAGAGAEHLQTRGDGVALASSNVAPLTMVLHELATNAAKHGAWSRDGGKVEVAWAYGGDRTLRLDWRERGGPELSATPTPGYGLRLIEGIVDHQLGGEAVMTFEEGGLLCTLRFPTGRS